MPRKMASIHTLNVKRKTMKVRNAVTEEEENCEKIIKDLFTTHTTHCKCELDKVSDRLISDITYI